MSEATTGQVSTAAAELYERFFVPALFGQWPPRLLDLAEVRPGGTVLDVGCGTGVLARAARDRVGPDGEVVGLDPNDGMLAVARRTASDVTWVEGVAEELPLESDSVDRVLSQFALMFFTDPGRAVGEMRAGAAARRPGRARDLGRGVRQPGVRRAGRPAPPGGRRRARRRAARAVPDRHRARAAGDRGAGVRRVRVETLAARPASRRSRPGSPPRSGPGRWTR